MTKPHLCTQHIVLVSLTVVALAFLLYTQESSASKYNLNNHYAWKLYYKHMRGKLRKPKGHCNITIPLLLNGTDPIRSETAKGNTVLLFMAKATDRQRFSLWQLEPLNNLAKWYERTGQKVTFLVMNHRNSRLPASVFTLFRNLKFYQEPKPEPGKPSIFRQLYGRYRDVFVYDQCGRQQCRISYPLSSTSYQFVKNAVHNALYFYNLPQMCGPCKQVPGPSPGDEDGDGIPDEKPPPDRDTTLGATPDRETSPGW